jgi:hypothetical protein
MGKNTKNHDNEEYPALHIKFNIHVQNKIYTTFITKINTVLGTSHANDPMQ